MKRLICVAVAIIFAFHLCGCAGDVYTSSITVSPQSDISSSIEKVQGIFSLPYNTDKPLNPFNTDSFLNISLASVLTEGLIFSEGGSIDYILAESVVSNETATVYTVKLKENMMFSDGSAVTSHDVVKSTEQILINPNSYYYGNMKNITSVTSVDLDTVSFSLNIPDPNFTKVLTFPIIQNGSSDENFAGTGPYMIINDGQSVRLSANQYWHGGEVVSDTINLVGTSDARELHYLLQSGKIDYYYTDDPFITSGSFSSSECETHMYGILAFNTVDGLLSDYNIRRSLSYNLNRDELLSSSEIFASSYNSLKETDAVSVVEALSKNGYTRTDENGFKYKRVSNKNIYAEISFAYVSKSSKNDSTVDYICSYLSSEGIKVTASSFVSIEALLENSASNPFDIVYTEVELLTEASIAKLFEISSAVAWDEALYLHYNEFLYGQTDLETFTSAFESSLSFNVLYRRKVKIMYSRSFSDGLDISPSTAYKNIHTWSILE